MTAEPIPPVWTLKRSDPLYYKALRAQRIARGVCTNCTRPAVEGKRRCAACAARVAQVQSRPKHRAAHSRYIKLKAKARHDQGLCKLCGRPLGMLDRARNVNCHICRAGATARARAAYDSRRALRQSRIAAGLCPRCGGPTDGYVHCAACRAKGAEAARRHAARKRTS